MKASQVRPAQKLLVAAISGIVCSIAQAQVAPGAAQPNSNSNEVPEVVVTAQRTASLASRTPVAMSVVTGEQLRDIGADSAATLGPRLPNVHFDQAFSGLRVTIRGISNNDTTDKGDPSAAFMQDGVYISRPAGQSANFLDGDRVEVPRGHGRHSPHRSAHVARFVLQGVAQPWQFG